MRDVEHQPEARERRDHRRSSIAHERKRESFDGRQSCRHGDVVDHLEGEAGEHAEHEYEPRRSLASRAASSARRITNRYRPSATRTPAKPCSSASTEKMKSLWATGQEPQLALRPLLEALARQAPGPDRDARLDLLVAGAFRILRRVEKRRNPRFLIVLERELPRDRRREEQTAGTSRRECASASRRDRRPRETPAAASPPCRGPVPSR